MTDEEIIEAAGQRLVEAVSAPAGSSCLDPPHAVSSRATVTSIFLLSSAR